jgi:hypothetical protein
VAYFTHAIRTATFCLPHCPLCDHRNDGGFSSAGIRAKSCPGGLKHLKTLRDFTLKVADQMPEIDLQFQAHFAADEFC